MGKASRPKARPRATPEPRQQAWPVVQRRWVWPALCVAIVLVCYWIPLTSANTSPQWDAVDVHYSSQKYFADRLLRGELPHWTPYIFAGFPFLADPQVGAWYPLNWPFFLAGITPKAIQAELALHALLACWGAFLLFRRFVAESADAFAGAMFYALSGFFAEHSSHVGMFSTAAAFPWLLLFVDSGIERDAVKKTVFAGLCGGAMLLAGHFQTSLYAFGAVGLLAVARIIERPKSALRILSVVAATAVIAVLLSSIQTLPALELTQESVRSGADYSGSRERVLTMRGLLNTIWPNATGVFDHPDGTGITDAQYYLYSGFLLLPLAILGLQNKRLRWLALLLILPPLWYMSGPDGGFFRLFGFLPGFKQVRAPIHCWFVPVLGLAMLACAGVSRLGELWKHRYARLIVIAVVFADLFFWNSLKNPLAYARYSFAGLYGDRMEMAREKVLSTQPPVTRFTMPDRLTVFGPLNHPLDLGLEASYGYNPLELRAYAQYRQAMAANEKLQDGLNISRYLDASVGGVVPNAGVLPRAYFPKRVLPAADTADSGKLLGTLDPAEGAIVIGRAPVDPSAAVSNIEAGEQSYRVRYRSNSPALLKVSLPYFPGWQASVDGTRLDVLRVDHALCGVVVPPGDKELVLRFESKRFGLGLALSLGTLGLSLAGWFIAARRAKAVV